MLRAVDSPHTAGRLNAAGVVFACALLTACTGSIQGAEGPTGVNRPPSGRDGEVRDCSELQIDLTPIRLLTRTEYNNTVRDLLGDDTKPLVDSPSAKTGGFDNNANALSVSSPMANHFLEVAQQISVRAMGNPGGFIKCTPEGDGSACAEDVIRKLGRRAFRRPVPEAEVSALLDLYGAVRANAGWNEAMAMVIQGILNSPRFLYHIEIGTDLGNGVAELDDYEIASKLSYYLWNSTPDETLDAAADAGELHTPEQIRTQAMRMLMSDRAREVAASMESQWFDLAKVRAVTKDLAQYRELTEEVRNDMIKETLTLLDDLVWNREGTVKDMVNTPYTFVNGRLADFYGIGGVSGDEFQRVNVADTGRLGVLTQGSIMMSQAKLDRTSPVHRGLFVRSALLCETLPEAPPNVPALEVIDPTRPVRERLAQHRENRECAGCHQFMDPLGFAFEHFDAVGRVRDVDEHGNAVDSSAEWVDLGYKAPTQKFDDAAGLAKALAEDPRVARCATRKWFQFAMGRTDDKYDACTVDKLTALAEAGSIKDLILAVTSQDVFRYRATVEPVGGCE